MCLSTTSLYACKLVSFQKLENRLNQPTMFLTSGLDQKQDSNEQHIYIYTLPSITTVCYILGSKTDFSAACCLYSHEIFSVGGAVGEFDSQLLGLNCSCSMCVQHVQVTWHHIDQLLFKICLCARLPDFGPVRDADGRLDFLELCSGSGRLTEACAEHGLVSLPLDASWLHVHVM